MAAARMPWWDIFARRDGDGGRVMEVFEGCGREEGGMEGGMDEVG